MIYWNGLRPRVPTHFSIYKGNLLRYEDKGKGQPTLAGGGAKTGH